MTLNGWTVKAGVNRTIWADHPASWHSVAQDAQEITGGGGILACRIRSAAHRGEDGAGKRALNWTVQRRLGTRLARCIAVAPSAHRPIVAMNCQSILVRWGRRCSAPAYQAMTFADRRSSRAMASFAIVRTDPAMWPRVRTGRFVIVSPAAAVRIGDDVLVRLRGDDNQFLVKQFAGKNSVGYRFRQFHPDVNFDLQPQHSIDR